MQVQQILMNLCVNARDAMAMGGQIVVRSTLLEVSAIRVADHPGASPGTYVALSVEDTGCGMSKEQLELAFEPFYTTKNVGEGTGLGLSTVYGLARQHQGWVQLESEVGRGTTVTVFFPVGKERKKGEGMDRQEAVVGGSESILLAEDDPAVQELAKIILEREGYRVQVASDGQEALDILERDGCDIHLALLDVMMPRVGGKQVYDTSHGRYPHLRFLFASGFSDSDLHTDSLLEEGLDLLQKPYRPEDLLARVKASLSRD